MTAREPAPPLRPVFVNGKFCAQRTTGVQRYARHLLVALDASLAGHPDGRTWTLLVPPGAQVPTLRAVRVRTLSWAGPGGLHGWEQVALPWAARQGRLLCLSGSAPAWAARQGSVLHDAAVFDHPEAYSAPFRRWYRWLFRRLARRADPLMTISGFSRDRLSAALQVPASRFDIVPGGADHLGAVMPADLPPDLQGRRFVMAVGSANPTKNLAALQAAWARVDAPAHVLVLAGGSHPRVFADAGTSPVGDRTLVLTSVDDALLVALYRHADALAFPSVYEGFGLPPLEAMLEGCPVLAAHAASLPEVCGDAALYVDPRDIAGIAAGLQRLVDDAALRADLRARGLARAATLTWAAAGAQLRQVLEARWQVGKGAGQ